MSRPFIALSLVLLLFVSTARAVTCDFSYQLTPTPQTVGLRLIDTSSGPVMIWYPATVEPHVQVTDERDPTRMSLYDYFVAAKFGTRLRTVGLVERNEYLGAREQKWFDKGARDIQVAHMLAANMQAQLDAPELPAAGIIIGNIDPIAGERLAGNGLIVINLQSSIVFQDDAQRQALAKTLKTDLPTWLKPEELKLKRTLLIQEPMSVAELQQLRAESDATAIIINHHLTPDKDTGALDVPILAFHTDDTTEDDRAALKQIVGASIDLTVIPKLETQLLSAAGYEACARMAFSKEIYQGLHLHHRRTVILADMLSFIAKRQQVKLALQGTHLRNPDLDKDIGVQRRKKI